MLSTSDLYKPASVGRHNYYSKNSIILLGILFIAALFIRIQFVKLTIDGITIVRDAKQYVQYAKNLVDYGVYSKTASSQDPQPDSHRSPGYPVFIALTMSAGGEDFLPILVFAQALMGALLVPFTFLTGIFFLPAAGALIAAMLVAFSPHLVTVTGCVLTESQFAFFLLGALCSFMYALASRHTALFIISAVLFGCAYLTNETALFLPYLIVIIYFMFKRSALTPELRHGILPKMALFLAIFTIAPMIWSVRNYLNVPPGAKKGSDRAIVTMSHGAYPDFIYKNPRYKCFPYREDPMQPAFGSSITNFMNILWDRAKTEPARYAKWYLVGKPYYLWSWNIIQGVGDIYIYPVKVSLFDISPIAGLTRSVMRSIHPVLVLLALSGIPLLFFSFRYRESADMVLNSALLPMAICIYYTLLYTVFAPWPRYSIPLRPELYLCSLWSLTIIIGLKSKKGQWNYGKK